MGFLRRLRGAPPEPPADAAANPEPAAANPDAAADEQAREKELLRDEAHRLDDELIQRQLRYAGWSWTPPMQGGTRRADDEEAKRESVH